MFVGQHNSNSLAFHIATTYCYSILHGPGSKWHGIIAYKYYNMAHSLNSLQVIILPGFLQIKYMALTKTQSGCSKTATELTDTVEIMEAFITVNNGRYKSEILLSL